MYTSIVGSFLNSVQALRFYVDSVESVALKVDKELDETSMVAMLLYIAKEFKIRNMDSNDLVFPEEFSDEVKKWIGDGIEYFGEIVEISGDGKTGRYRNIPKKIKESYIKLEALQKQSEILYSGSLMLLITYFENTIAKILKADLKRHPGRMSLDTKTMPYKVLEMADSIDDVRDLLIDEEVMAMMYKSASDWINYFKKSLKLNLKYATSKLPQLIEIISRRNLIVHNEGIVNNVYLNLVLKEYCSHVKIGDTLIVDKQYILDAINLVESIGMEIIIEMWIKDGAKNEKEIDKIIEIIYHEYLIFERWENARILYEVCLESNKFKLADELMCKINKWQCYKWLDRFDEIKKEVEELDVSACQPMYKLGILALLDNYEDFFPYFDNQSDVSETELKEWPLFRKVRENQIYIQRYGISD